MSGLRAVAVALLGDDAEVVLHPAITFGAESSASQMLPAADSGVLLTLALFGLAATPENENHGTFLKALRSASESARLAVLIDESGYRRRLGVQASRCAPGGTAQCMAILLPCARTRGCVRRSVGARFARARA